MQKFTNPLYWLVGVSVAIVVGAYLWLSGSAIVVDETGGVQSAVVTNGYHPDQPLYKLWGGKFYAIPDIEGTIEVRCADGMRKQWGYVTKHWHTKIKVVGKTPCARLVDAN